MSKSSFGYNVQICLKSYIKISYIGLQCHITANQMIEIVNKLYYIAYMALCLLVHVSYMVRVVTCLGIVSISSPS